MKKERDRTEATRREITDNSKLFHTNDKLGFSSTGERNSVQATTDKGNLCTGDKGGFSTGKRCG